MAENRLAGAGGIDRRSVLAGAVGALAVATAPGPSRAATGLKALAFDGFALFDLRPVFARAERVFPGHGEALAAAWRTRIFDYTWLRTAAGRYAEFPVCIDGALRFAAASLGLILDEPSRLDLLAGFAEIKAFADVAPALAVLKAAGLRLVVLANPTEAMLARAVANSGLDGVFDALLSTDRAKTYKPDPRAYALGTAALDLAPAEIGFVASAGWDATGAAWYGYRSFWVNRGNAPAEGLDAGAETVVPDLAALASQLTA